MSKKILIDKEQLYDLFITQNKSLNELCSFFNASLSVIQRNLKAFGIKKDLKNRTEIIKKQNLEKYGVEWFAQTEESKESHKLTNLKKYGVDNPSRVKDFQKKREQTLSERYGKDVINPSQIPGHIEKSKKTSLNKYGVDNFNKKHFSEKTLAILSNKENFKSWLKDNSNLTIAEIAEKLFVSYTTIEETIHKYNLEKLINFCPFVSKEEKEIRSFLDELGIEYIVNEHKIIKGKEIDIYCPKQKVAIEFNGNYWHSDLQKDKNYHFNKSKECERQGIRLIHIFEYEWNNKKELIKSILKIALGKVGSKIYARQCVVKEITNKEAEQFNNKNHLQGHRNAQITYGLFYKGELVQLMSFSHHKKYDWEIIRGCPKNNNVIIGGVSKLFKHFIKIYNPNTVFSYCDFNKYDGKGYKSLGMKFVGYTGPDMKWWLGNNDVINRSPTKRKEIEKIARGKIWGAGSKKFLLDKSKK